MTPLVYLSIFVGAYLTGWGVTKTAKTLIDFYSKPITTTPYVPPKKRSVIQGEFTPHVTDLHRAWNVYPDRKQIEIVRPGIRKHGNKFPTKESPQ